ncbi:MULTISPECIES: hypothetical protein [unclassified Arthrobacter]|uniref:hypothetical protein n=1 Tax=unclassified Arthrobacter TaxID=235627 RepID=UPI003394784E
MVANQTKAPTVSAVIQEHIDLLVRPSVGTVHTYQTMLKLHLADIIGHIPVDKLNCRHLTYWIKAMQTKGRSAKTIKNNHGLIFFGDGENEVTFLRSVQGWSPAGWWR